MPIDDQGLYYPEYNPFLDALNAGLPLPQLTTPNPTQADLDLYRILSSPDYAEQLPALVNNNLWIGNQPNANYPQGGIFGHSLADAFATGQITDPGLYAYAQQLVSNSRRRDVVDNSPGGIVARILDTAPYAVAGAFAGADLAAGLGAASAGTGAATETGAGIGSAGTGASAPSLAAATPEFTAPFAGTGLEALAPNVEAGLGFGTGAAGTSGLGGLEGSPLLTAGTTGGSGGSAGAGEAILSPLPEGAIGGGAASPELVAGTTGGGGLFGTGITGTQLAKLGITALPTLASLASGGPGSATGTGTAPNPDQEKVLAQLRALGLGSSIERGGAEAESQIRQTAQANASTNELMKSLGPAVQQLRQRLQQSFKAISGQLGPSGGGQIERANRAATETAGSGLQSLFTNQASGGVGQLLQSLQGFRPTNVAQVPQTVQVNRDVPNQFGDIPGAVRGIGQLYRSLGSSPPPPATTGTASDVPALEALFK